MLGQLVVGSTTAMLTGGLRSYAYGAPGSRLVGPVAEPVSWSRTIRWLLFGEPTLVARPFAGVMDPTVLQSSDYALRIVDDDHPGEGRTHHMTFFMSLISA